MSELSRLSDREQMLRKRVFVLETQIGAQQQQINELRCELDSLTALVLKTDNYKLAGRGHD